jgi:hypothetical protein
MPPSRPKRRFVPDREHGCSCTETSSSNWARASTYHHRLPSTPGLPHAARAAYSTSAGASCVRLCQHGRMGQSVRDRPLRHTRAGHRALGRSLFAQLERFRANPTEPRHSGARAARPPRRTVLRVGRRVDGHVVYENAAPDVDARRRRALPGLRERKRTRSGRWSRTRSRSCSCSKSAAREGESIPGMLGH